MSVLWVGSAVQKIVNDVTESMNNFEEAFIGKTNATVISPLAGVWQSVQSSNFVLNKLKPRMEELNKRVVREVAEAVSEFGNTAERVINNSGGMFRATIPAIGIKSIVEEQFRSFKNNVDSVKMDPDGMDSIINVLKNVEENAKNVLADAIRKVQNNREIGEEQKNILVMRLNNTKNGFFGQVTALIAELVNEVKGASAIARGTGVNGGSAGYVATGSNSYMSTGSNGGYRSYVSTGSNSGYSSYVATGSNSYTTPNTGMNNAWGRPAVPASPTDINNGRTESDIIKALENSRKHFHQYDENGKHVGDIVVNGLGERIY